MARKYAYEFQIPMQDLKLTDLENKMRIQISENFALFNEICPVYISLNMGRPVNESEESNELKIANFRLVDRKSATVTGQYLTINFLKCDLPFQMIRIIAFDNRTCETYQLDLTKDDLLILTEGHMRLLEEENLNDLCSLVLNQLTMIHRKLAEQKAGD